MPTCEPMHVPFRQPRPVWQSHAVLHAAPSPPRSGAGTVMSGWLSSPAEAMSASVSPPPPTESGFGDVQPIQIRDATSSRYRMSEPPGVGRLLTLVPRGLHLVKLN